jgi:hypothetical protein
VNSNSDISTVQSGPVTNAVGWDLRHPGLIMKDGEREVHEFTGMWPLKPDANLVGTTDVLSREAPFWGGPGKTFSEATTHLGLIRAARWFVGNSTEFGPTLYFMSQFDSSLEKYFDDFVLNGRENLEKIWGECIGCPTGPNATARDIVQYIARGQIKTLACYDAFPSLSNSQMEKQADWYAKTQKFQRAVMGGAGSLEDKVNAFLSELAKPFDHVRSAAAIDTDVARQLQFTDVPERLGVKNRAA